MKNRTTAGMCSSLSTTSSTAAKLCKKKELRVATVEGAEKRGLVRRDPTDAIVMRGPSAASSAAPIPYWSYCRQARQREREGAAMQAEDHLERQKEGRECAAMAKEDPEQEVEDDCGVQ